MVTFVATQQVEVNHLLELGTIADTSPSEISARTSAGFTVTQGNVKFLIGGNGIGYQSGFPTSGNITSLRIIIDDDFGGPLPFKEAYRFTNFSYSVSQAFNILGQPPEQAVQTILAGIDTVIGSAFADTLFGYNGDDTVRGGNGNDFIDGGNGNDKLFGDAGNDNIRGGEGADQVHGGLGNDVLRGDGGPDRFYFDTALNKNTNVDTVVFLAGDRIVLDRTFFAQIDDSDAKLNAAEFVVVGATPITAAHRIIYNSTNGALQYDADGLGGAAGVRFATLAGGPDHVDRTDFILVA